MLYLIRGYYRTERPFIPEYRYSKRPGAYWLYENGGTRKGRYSKFNNNRFLMFSTSK